MKTLLKGSPMGDVYPKEPVNEEPVEIYTKSTKKNRKFWNQKLKVNCQIDCLKIDQTGILCGDKPGYSYDQKATSLFYLCIGTEGRIIFRCKHPHFFIEKRPVKELWKVMEDSAIRSRNITYDGFVLFLLNNGKESLV